MAIETFPVKLISAKNITSNVRHLCFQRTDGEILTFVPGQFITIHFPHDEKTLRRSYSIATIPDQKTTHIEFALSYFKGGAASELLFNLKPGDELNIAGPYGRLILRDEQPLRYILVATGTGVTPYRSMLPELRRRLQQQPALQVLLLEGVQTREDLLYGDDFLAMAKQESRFQFQAHYSRENDTALQSHERQGYVQTAYAHLHLDPANDIIYLCGNPKMIDDSVELLTQQGFTIQQLRREKYIS
jgi:ferredoxin-NADP reductase